MFQSFTAISDPSRGAKRLSALRAEMRRDGLAGFLVPRADAWQGENVAPGDERLAWLTGFSGSAGLCAVLHDKAAVFIDGRYVLAVRDQIDLAVYEPVATPAGKPADWLAAALPDGGSVGLDPWLHGHEEVTKLAEALAARGITLRPCANLVDRIWRDRPAPPVGQVSVQRLEFSGESHQSKRERLAAALREANQAAAVLTAPESLAWLLNIRGSDIERVPVPHGFAILHDDARVTLFIEPAKLGAEVRAHLGNAVELAPMPAFGAAIDALAGPVRLDPAATPVWLRDRLQAKGTAIDWAEDPCLVPRAIKNAVELEGARIAHQRDAVAMVRFLHWLDTAIPRRKLTEIDVVRRLEDFRSGGGLLRDISFDTICGSGPNGAVVHYHVSTASNRPIRHGDVLLVDSGGQYSEGTTDITRTLAFGAVNPAAARAFTLVLKGMIAVSRARWPVGLSGRDLDAFARAPLWQAGLDYDHGTGHGVGSFLGVHEGPQGISRRTSAVLEPGMILSNEPGYYREGEFGVRIENLVVVLPATVPDGGERAMHAFETLTLAPIDRAMIVPALLDAGEREWLNAYHARVLAAIGPLLPKSARAWLAVACAPLHA